MKRKKSVLGFWWVLILSIILGAIVGVSIMYCLKGGNFIVLSGWAAAGLSIVPVLVVFYQLNLQRNKESLAEHNKDISVRPRPSFRYLNKLNLGQIVYYNGDSRVWIDDVNKKRDAHMMNLLYANDFQGRKKIGFFTSDRFGPSILGIRNVCNHDMYDCKLTMIYACGSEVNNIKDGYPVDMKKLNQQIHVEYLEIPVIEARQEIAVVNYAKLCKVPFLMVTLKIDYGTERGEALETIFASNGEEMKIEDYTDNMDSIARTRELSEHEVKDYHNFIHRDNRIFSGVNDYVRNPDEGLNGVALESNNRDANYTTTQTTRFPGNR